MAKRKRNSDDGLVYSTDHGRMCPDCGAEHEIFGQGGVVAEVTLRSDLEGLEGPADKA